MHWAVPVCAIYGLAAGILYARPAVSLPLLGTLDPHEALLAALVCLMVASQVVLILVPVRRQARPERRMSVIPAILATGVLFGALVFGAALSLQELVEKDPFVWKLPITSMVLGLAFWILWGTLFTALYRNLDGDWLVPRLLRGLVAGSVLELLVAVPSHVVARSRDYCCAGASTFIGLACGVSVLFIALGPAALLLYYDRVARKRASWREDEGEAP